MSFTHKRDCETADFMRDSAKDIERLNSQIISLLETSFGKAGLNALGYDIWNFHGLVYDAYMAGAAKAESRAIDRMFRQTQQASTNMLKAARHYQVLEG